MKAILVALLAMTAQAATSQDVTMDTTMATNVETNSLFFFAPATSGHNVEIKPGLLVNTTKLEAKTAGVKTEENEISNSVSTLTYQYTVSKAMTWGVSTTLGSIKTKNTPVGSGSSESKESGMGDLVVKYSGFSPSEGTTWRWGADLGFSPGKKKIANGTTDGNLYSGGMSLTPYAAWEAPSTVLTWGVGASYSLLLERTAEAVAPAADDTKITGGNILTIKPYIETPIGGGRVGGFLKYASSSETKSKTGAGPEATAFKAGSTLGLGGAVAYGFTESISGLAELEYNTINQDTVTGTGLALTIGGRATF
jgi:hypothetical protein